METKWLYLGLRVVAASLLLACMGIVLLGVSDIWELFTEDLSPNSTAEKMLYSLIILGGMTLVGVTTLAVSGALWHMNKILARF